MAYQFGGAPAAYALEGSIAITGALIQWLRDSLGIVGSAAEASALAAEVPDNGGVYIVPAFSGLYAPYWRADARGTIVGLTRFADRRHLCRAALEAAAYQTCDVVEAMEQDAGLTLTTLKVDGGMVASEPLMQFQADMLGRDVVRPEVQETTALGGSVCRRAGGGCVAGDAGAGGAMAGAQPVGAGDAGGPPGGAPAELGPGSAAELRLGRSARLGTPGPAAFDTEQLTKVFASFFKKKCCSFLKKRTKKLCMLATSWGGAAWTGQCPGRPWSRRYREDRAGVVGATAEGAARTGCRPGP